MVRAFFRSAYANSPTSLGKSAIVSAPRLCAFTGFAVAATKVSSAHAAVNLIDQTIHFFMQCSFRGLGVETLVYATPRRLAEPFAQFVNLAAHLRHISRVFQAIQVDLHVCQCALGSRHSH